MDEVTATPATPTPPAPATPADPAAALTPSQTYTAATKSRMKEWKNAPEPEAEVVEEEAPAADVEVEGAEATPATPGMETGRVSGTSAGETGEIPAEALEAAEEDAPELSSQEVDRPFAAAVGESEFSVPEGLTLTYKADGQEVSRPIEDVIKFAQLGENYDRRSRDLAHQQRNLKTQFESVYTDLTTRYQQAEAELIQTARRLAEDDEFREQYLDEFERLRSNPEELQIRLAAEQGQRAMAELAEIRKQQQNAYQSRVWATVDEIIAEGIGTEQQPGRFQFADPDLVRRRFHEEYSRDAATALSEPFLNSLLAQDHERIARHVDSARRDTLGRATKVVQQEVSKARADAVSEAKNTQTTKALDRAQQAKKVVTSAPGATPSNGKRRIETIADSTKALKSWASS